eukprot:2668343-Alexandrium_andersonii.AAC.1
MQAWPESCDAPDSPTLLIRAPLCGVPCPLQGQSYMQVHAEAFCRVLAFSGCRVKVWLGRPLLLASSFG